MPKRNSQLAIFVCLFVGGGGGSMCAREQIDQNRFRAHKPIKSNQWYTKRRGDQENEEAIAREHEKNKPKNTRHTHKSTRKKKMLIYGEMWNMWLDADNVWLCEIFMLPKLRMAYTGCYMAVIDGLRRCWSSTHAVYVYALFTRTFFTFFCALRTCLIQ